MHVNSLPPGSDRDVNSPHNLNEMSVRQVLTIKDIISLRCDFDITKNSHDYIKEKYIVLVRRMNVSILAMVEMVEVHHGVCYIAK